MISAIQPCRSSKKKMIEKSFLGCPQSFQTYSVAFGTVDVCSAGRRFGLKERGGRGRTGAEIRDNSAAAGPGSNFAAIIVYSAISRPTAQPEGLKWMRL